VTSLIGLLILFDLPVGQDFMKMMKAEFNF